ncbi:unnamed protein product [Rangifer tarandus platyrhynchus]|uniref:Uncharacterized protein n=1 Tax=Rangifer tarandus platyrhynchus TaxID=3082113 RepID=A0AC59YES4_RANTA
MLGGALRGALVSAAKRDDVCDPCPDLPSLRYGGIYRLTRRADVRRRHSGIGEALSEPPPVLDACPPDQEEGGEAGTTTDTIPSNSFILDVETGAHGQK